MTDLCRRACTLLPRKHACLRTVWFLCCLWRLLLRFGDASGCSGRHVRAGAPVQVPRCYGHAQGVYPVKISPCFERVLSAVNGGVPRGAQSASYPNIALLWGTRLVPGRTVGCCNVLPDPAWFWALILVYPISVFWRPSHTVIRVRWQAMRTASEGRG